MSYWLKVQEHRGDKPVGEPFLLAGPDVIFDDTYRLKLNIVSAEPGCLYLLNEPPRKLVSSSAETQTESITLIPVNIRIADPLYAILFASTAKGDYPAALEIEIPPGDDWIIFRDKKGTEKLWLVWSAQPVAELEAVKGLINAEDEGKIRNPIQAQAIQKFLTMHSESVVNTARDTESRRTTISTKSNVIAHLMEIRCQ